MHTHTYSYSANECLVIVFFLIFIITNIIVKVKINYELVPEEGSGSLFS